MAAQECLDRALNAEEKHQKLKTVEFEKRIILCLEKLAETQLPQFMNWREEVDNSRADVKAIKLKLENAGYQVRFSNNMSVGYYVFVISRANL